MAHPSHLCSSSPFDWTVLSYQGAWKASVIMTQTQAKDKASDLRLSGVPARAERASFVCNMGMPDGPPTPGSPAYLGEGGYG